MKKYTRIVTILFDASSYDSIMEFFQDRPWGLTGQQAIRELVYQFGLRCKANLLSSSPVSHALILSNLQVANEFFNRLKSIDPSIDYFPQESDPSPESIANFLHTDVDAPQVNR